MIDFFKESLDILSPMNGEVISISSVDDEVFSSKMLGDGVALVPSDGYIFAPCDGTILQVFETRHAYSLISNDGVEILIHIGIDTVKLNGEGFETYVLAGKSVKKTDKIGFVDLDLLKKKGYNTQTPIIISNGTILKDLSFSYGLKKACKDLIINYKLK